MYQSAGTVGVVTAWVTAWGTEGVAVVTDAHPFWFDAGTGVGVMFATEMVGLDALAASRER